MHPDMLDYEQLDSCIQNTVRLLRQWGFNTIDSGDGVSKQDAEHLPFAHVCIAVDPHESVSAACELLRLLNDEHIDLDGDARRIECSYSPIDDNAILMLIGVDDMVLVNAKAHPRRA